MLWRTLRQNRKGLCKTYLNPRHAVLEVMSRAQKPHRYDDFKRKKSISNCKKTVIDALLMMLDYFS